MTSQNPQVVNYLSSSATCTLLPKNIAVNDCLYEIKQDYNSPHLNKNLAQFWHPVNLGSPNESFLGVFFKLMVVFSSRNNLNRTWSNLKKKKQVNSEKNALIHSIVFFAYIDCGSVELCLTKESIVRGLITTFLTCKSAAPRPPRPAMPF